MIIILNYKIIKKNENRYMCAEIEWEEIEKMKWEKKGKICDCNTFDLPWFKKNSMVPLPYLRDENTIRIFLTMCDEYNIGRIGYVDVSADNPSDILDYSETPLIDIGDDGHFDDNGVVTASLLEVGDALYMFYSGYQTCVKVPYMIFTGLAVSHDRGASFEKITKEVPVLDRVPGECGTRCVPFVIKEGETYRMWYTADFGSGWLDTPKKREPYYDMKYMESDEIMKWPSKGETVITFNNPDEHGICKCTVWKEDGIYKIIYSLRHVSKGYRLGYAESKDGIHFTRMDDKLGLTISENGFDDDMICFAERIVVKDNIYLIYSGNHYGMGGIGYAKLISE